ncbi:MAG: PKD domain-containing protein, partial [Planctomycetota bacterium]
SALLHADTITGRVVDVNGVGLPGIDIDATSLGSGGNPHLTNDGTDANGNFTATIDSGVYRLFFYAPPPPTSTLLAGVLDNLVVVGTVNLGTIVLQPGVSLSGRTVDSAGLPLAGVKVVVNRTDTGALVPMKANTSNAFGNFAVAVPTTALTVDLDPTPILTRILVPRRLSVTPAGATNLGNLTLLDGFTLSGSVTTTSGVPVNGVDLDVLDSATGVKLHTPGDRTSGLGAFTLRVPPGTYDVQFCPSFASRLVAREFKNQTIAASVNVGAVPLLAGVALSGRVFDVNGTPLPGVDLSVDLSSSGASILTCNDDTNASGNYAVIVPAATLDISFAYPGRHGTSAADLHANFVVPSDTVLDGVLPAPTAQFTGTPLVGGAPLPVQFADLSTGAVTSWSWSFGDGASSTLASPSHTYALNGSYAVSLTVSGPGGPHTRTEPGFVFVGDAPPLAEFTGTPTSGSAPLVVAFTNQSTGAIATHAWSFGDGASSSLASPSHTYTAPGTYTVTLTETGPGG